MAKDVYNLNLLFGHDRYAQTAAINASEGVAFVSNTAEVPALDGAGMYAMDVLHKVDGTDIVGRLMTFNGSVFTVNLQGLTSLIPRDEVVSIALSQPQLRPKLLYVGSDTDDLANANVAEALEAAGFDLTSATRLPASLEGFDVVVLESISASSAEAANMLRSFVGKGGGVVIVGTVPMELCPEGERYVSGWGSGELKSRPWDTSSIADWLGAATMESVRIANPRVAASFANPFFACPDIMVGQELYVFQGESDSYYFVTGSLSAQARPVTKIRFEDNGIEYTNIAAFAHPFGTGRGCVPCFL